jgi:hypothetical protein
MSDGELIAWQAGTDWCRAGLSLTRYATASAGRLYEQLGDEAGEALRQLGRDTFGHWFITGFHDAHRARGQ